MKDMFSSKEQLQHELDEIIKLQNVYKNESQKGVNSYAAIDAYLDWYDKTSLVCKLAANGIDLQGYVMFYTAVSPAGIGPTSSNKLEIESGFEPLSAAGLKMHLGKGAIKPETVASLAKHNAVFAVIPPVTALLDSKTSNIECVAYSELGMEALYRVHVDHYEAIIAAAHGKSIYDK